MGATWNQFKTVSQNSRRHPSGSPGRISRRGFFELSFAPHRTLNYIIRFGARQDVFNSSTGREVIRESANRKIGLIHIILGAVTFAAFLQLTRCDFINYDDPAYVTENMHIRHGVTMAAIRWAFTTDYASNWHPLTWMSHMLDVQLFGLNPRRHHLVSLLFHIANTLLLFHVFNRMTKAPWKSAFVAALFALHPLHVESVAWVAERKDVLSTFFWMLTMAAYVRYVERPSVVRYSTVLIFFAPGLMSKPMLVTLPFVLLLLDYWPLGRPFLLHSSPAGLRRLFLEKVPLFVLSGLSCIVTYAVQKSGGAVKSFEAFPFGARIANALVSYVIYMGRAVWPIELSIFYPYPGPPPLWQVLGAAAVLCAVTFAAVRLAKRFPPLLFGWLWFTGTLIPVIGIVQVGRQAMADRYTYVPLVGLFVIVSWGAPSLLAGLRPDRPLFKRALTAFSASALLFFLFIVTWMQAGCWNNSITLYDHALEVTSNNSEIYYNRGVVYKDAGDLTLAIADFDRAIEINPGRPEAYINRGLVYDKLGNPARAIADFDAAVRVNPGSSMAYNNRGIAYTRLGDHRQAISDFEKAVEADPNDPNPLFNLGHAQMDEGNYALAMETFGKLIKLDPDYAPAYANRGLAYDALGSEAKALEDFNRAIAIKPDDWRAYNARAAVCARLGYREQAAADLERAIKFGGKEAEEILKDRGINR
jgi:tetratricopeptide (TPR) repeat protein